MDRASVPEVLSEHAILYLQYFFCEGIGYFILKCERNYISSALLMYFLNLNGKKYFTQMRMYEILLLQALKHLLYNQIIIGCTVLKNITFRLESPIM